MKIDWSKFSRVESKDKNSAVLKHKDGHELRIAIKALSPKHRGQLEAIPMNKGGQVDRSDDVVRISGFSKKKKESVGTGQGDGKAPPSIDIPDPRSDIDKAAEAQGAANEANPSVQDRLEKTRAAAEAFNAKRAKKMADGGEVEELSNNSLDLANVTLPDPSVMSQAPAALMPQQSNVGMIGAPDVAYGTNMPMAGAIAAPQPAVEAPVQAAAIAPQEPQAAAAPAAAESSPDLMGVGQGYLQGINDQKAGIMAEADAIAKQAQLEQKALQEDMRVKQDAAAHYQADFNRLESERKDLQDDIRSNQIDPNRFMNRMGVGDKIATAIGLIIGGMGAGLTHTESAAGKFLENQIDRDINAQKMELGRKENLLSANMRQFGNLQQASEMTRIQQMDIVSNQLKVAAAKAMDPLAKARALQAAGKLEAEAGIKTQALTVKVTAQRLINEAQKDPKKAMEAIKLLQVVDPKAAEDLQKRYVAGIGIAPTAEDAKMAKETMIRRDNIKQNILDVKNMIGKYGTYEALGSHNADLDRKVDQIATDMAKLQDPNSVARPGEVELVRRTLVSPGIFSRNKTAIKIMQNFESEVDKRANTAMQQHGLGAPDPMSKLTPQQRQFAEWAQNNPNDPKSPLILRKLGLQ